MDPFLTGAFDLLTKGGLVAGLLIFGWLFFTDRLFTKARVQEYADRTEKAEKQRDDAIELARSAQSGMKELTAANQAVLRLYASRAGGQD